MHKCTSCFSELFRTEALFASLAMPRRSLYRNGDGKISTKELRKTLRKKLGIFLAAEQYSLLLQSFDVDGDGFVTVAEITDCLSRLLSESEPELQQKQPGGSLATETGRRGVPNASPHAQPTLPPLVSGG